ncbi:methylase of polypeptide subunit release factors [Agromyces hippuratus]|uniref:Methylase of polypeptide subunit release factors n=1 Tax=Agromyces hippuratus TaxID=286438 RepID=A0A852WXJ6_9MICO|nr:methyltransferase [Agromyces hippuratus]NYG22669.1 methylase of polypeptide subunit release factors [Agromyces hippuratus]
MSTEPKPSPLTLADAARVDELLGLLRADLVAADFTVEALEALWGDDAAAALHRGERVPARRVLDARRREHGASAGLATLAELFVLGVAVPRGELGEALDGLGVDGAIELGLVSEVGEAAGPGGEASVRARLDLRPYAFTDAHGRGEWWVISDLGELALGHALGEHHVLGVGGASMTLSGLMLPTPARRVLDLGTGCGIQAMHASRFADRIVATDISERALEIARLNLVLNGIDGVELRLGSLFEPVAGERFDRIVSNPPFVITPRIEGVPEYDYRDGGMVGDALVEAVIRGAQDHLEPGGVAQLLGNWEYRDGGAPDGDAGGASDGLERVGDWAAALEHWVIEREVQHVTEYAETWIRDGGTRPGTAEFDRLYDAWLDDFAARGVSHVGFGYVLLRRADAAASADSTAGAGRLARLARLERLHGPLGSNEAGLGAHLADCLVEHDRQAALDDAALAAARFTTAGDVTEERHYWPGDDDPTAMLLRQGGGFGRAISLDTGLAALVGASDGDLSVGAIVAALAQLLEVDETALAADLLPAVRTLVDDGMLRFAD